MRVHVAIASHPRCCRLSIYTQRGGNVKTLLIFLRRIDYFAMLKFAKPLKVILAPLLYLRSDILMGLIKLIMLVKRNS